MSYDNEQFCPGAQRARQQTESAEWAPLCDAQEPSHKPGYVAAGGCWRERGHDGDHLWTPEVSTSPATPTGGAAE